MLPIEVAEEVMARVAMETDGPCGHGDGGFHGGRGGGHGGGQGNKILWQVCVS
jgi:hypothetical protein